MQKPQQISKQSDLLLASATSSVTHIKDFTQIVAPLVKPTRKDSECKTGPLPEDAKVAFLTLQRHLTSKPVTAFPKSDWQYALITDVATGTAETTGGLRAILTQMHKDGNFFEISLVYRELKDHKNITHLSLWKLLPLCRECTFSMNISEGNNTFSTQITNLWKSWVICTTKL
jgi:hypothetical protein